MITVRTVNSTYLIDLDTMTVTRRTDGGELRKDGEPIPLLADPQPMVGWGMTLLLQVRDDPAITTLRMTSMVKEIIYS